MGDARSWQLEYSEHFYGSENQLQRLGVWQFPDLSAADVEDGSGYWLMYA
jgi:hypothetical protein